MDLGDLAQQHGPIGLLVAAVLLFVRQLAAGGIKITVSHDPAQMKELGAIIGKAAAGAERLDDIEEDVAELRESLATVKTQVDERTKKRSASTAPKAAAKG